MKRIRDYRLDINVGSIVSNYMAGVVVRGRFHAILLLILKVVVMKVNGSQFAYTEKFTTPPLLKILKQLGRAHFNMLVYTNVLFENQIKLEK